jgi:NAD(P)-dependent dehydrogenase (short-subunit alcohol dehydrogenase family)
MTTLIVGNGGIGAALAEHYETQDHVVQWSRSVGVDVCDETSIIAALSTIEGDLDRVIVTTGMLHDDTQKPEKSMRDLNADALARSFLINTIAPALIAKHTLPRLPRQKPSVFAALSARVGSISDNGTGGWHGYRASKAALNMMIKNFSIELRRTRPLAVCVGLHPGTVDTNMSKPFQANVAPGKLFTAEQSTQYLVETLEKLDAEDSGKIFAWDGSVIPS